VLAGSRTVNMQGISRPEHVGNDKESKTQSWLVGHENENEDDYDGSTRVYKATQMEALGNEGDVLKSSSLTCKYKLDKGSDETDTIQKKPIIDSVNTAKDGAAFSAAEPPHVDLSDADNV